MIVHRSTLLDEGSQHRVTCLPCASRVDLVPLEVQVVDVHVHLSRLGVAMTCMLRSDFVSLLLGPCSFQVTAHHQAIAWRF